MLRRGAWSNAKPLHEGELAELRSGSPAHTGERQFAPPTSEPGGRWKPVASRANDYLLDYETQRTRYFSGLPGNWGQDGGIQVSMGPVYDRAREHVGSADLGVIHFRRELIRAAKALRAQGTIPPGAGQPSGLPGAREHCRPVQRDAMARSFTHPPGSPAGPGLLRALGAGKLLTGYALEL